MPERVLLIRWSAIGDIVMALPAAATVRASDPDAEVAWFVETRFRELVRGHPAIDRVFCFDRGRYRSSGWNPLTWREQLRGYLQVRRFKPDTAIDMHGHGKTALAMLFCGARKKFILNPTDPFSRSVGGRVVMPAADLHAVDAYIEAVGAAGFRTRSYEFGIPVGPEQAKFVDGRLGPGGWATVHLGSTTPEKLWPPERFAQVGRALRTEGLRVVLVGGRGEEALRDRYLAAAEADDWVGRTTLLQTAEVIRRSRLHLSGDTGTAHIAAAFGVPCVTVFGHMSPSVYHPFGQPEAVVESGGDILSVRADAVLEKCLMRLRAGHVARE
ncbi:MAG: glycosyltransferase family 9 protein [Armatimonadetes bacterium]|nr:glycosyltransferase family 9 protein [Armatimonadota bacterium]